MGSVIDPERFKVKRVAIIGAGPSGLAGTHNLFLFENLLIHCLAAKYLLAEDSFNQIDVFEQQSEVGGVWNYSPNIVGKTPVPQITPNGPPELPIWPNGADAPLFSNAMYHRLNTNIPKTLMQYSDQDFLPDSLLFPTRQDVQTYLVKYSQDVRHLVSFSTQVEDIRRVNNGGADAWELSSRSVITKKEKKAEYDAILVANGHYSVPFIPEVTGIAAFNAAFPSIITHSKIYRSPVAFENKKVIVVGSAASGLDSSSYSYTNKAFISE